MSTGYSGAIPMGKLRTTETLIVSDIHLGTYACEAFSFLELLYTTEFKRLILLGDIIHSPNFYRFVKEHWSVLARIRKLTKEKHRKEIVWVAGNHDRRLEELMVNVLGTVKYGRDRRGYDEYTWNAGGKKFLAIHGDKYDYLYAANKLIQRTFESFTWLDSKLPIPEFLRSLSSLTHTTKVMEHGALRRAKHLEADVVFCGHTHKAKRETHGDIEYVNTGCWVQKPCHYVTVSAEGEVALEEFVSTGFFEKGAISDATLSTSLAATTPLI